MDLRIAKKLLEMNSTLTEHMEVNQILREVVQTAAEIIDRSEVLILYLYNERSNLIEFSYGVDVNEEALRNIQFLPGESIVGKIFVEQKPKLFKSEREIDQFMQDMRQKNFTYYYQGVYERKIKSTFCVPIVSKGRCYGVIIVNNFSEENAFTKDHMEVIQIIADHSAIALDNSSLYRHMKEKNELLSQSVDIHNKFYHLTLEGKGVEPAIQLLERIVQAPMALQTDKTDKDGHYFPIIRNKELLGYIQMSRPFTSFSKMNQIAIEQASFSIALEQMKQNEIFEKEIQFRSDVFERMLQNVASKEWQQMIQHLQWGEGQQICCIVIEGDRQALWNPVIRYERERFIQKVEEVCHKLEMRNLAITKDKQLVILMPYMQAVPRRQFIMDIEKSLSNSKSMITGVGRFVGIDDIGITYEEAVESLEMARKKNKKLVYYEQLGFERLLEGIDQSVKRRFVSDKIDALLSLGEIYIHTLQVYIQENKKHKQTASKLHIHQNTLYMRLKKIEEIVEVDLDQTMDWVNIVIALHLYGDKHN